MSIRRNDCLFVGIKIGKLLDLIKEKKKDSKLKDTNDLMWFFDEIETEIEVICDMDNTWLGRVLNQDEDLYNETGSPIKTFALWQLKEDIREVTIELEKIFDVELSTHNIELHHGTLWL